MRIVVCLPFGGTSTLLVCLLSSLCIFLLFCCSITFCIVSGGAECCGTPWWTSFPVAIGTKAAIVGPEADNKDNHSGGILRAVSELKNQEVLPLPCKTRNDDHDDTRRTNEELNSSSHSCGAGSNNNDATSSNTCATSIPQEDEAYEDAGLLVVRRGRGPVQSLQRPRPSGTVPAVTSTKTKSESTSSVTGYLNHLVVVYREALRNTISAQVESWHFIAAYEGVDEAEMGSCPAPRPARRVSPGTSTISPSMLSLAELEKFIWDDESDIPAYLDHIYWACAAPNAARHPAFKMRCGDFLRDLIYNPRCTTRFDSRVRCRRGEQPTASIVKTPSSLLDLDSTFQGYFTNSTLNVVIVGGGPTGLFLANSLAQASRAMKSSQNQRPEIRVIVIENRLQATGVKQGFTRSKQAIPIVEDMVETIDRRLGTIFSGISADEENEFLALPFNAIETLLLLSTRDLGVKFLYGDLKDFAPFLSKEPNLVAFDASGHRLDMLSRGSNCPPPQNTGTQSLEEVVYPWAPTGLAELDWKHIYPTEYAILKSLGFSMTIAEKGDLLYPVTDRGTPYATWWLHVHQLPGTDEYYEGHEEIWGHMTNRSFCSACMNPDYEDQDTLEEYKICEIFCQPNFFYSSSPYYRDDIWTKIKENRSNAWFAPSCAILHLSATEAKRLLELINKELAGGIYAKDPVGMPISLLPLDAMAREDVFKDSSVLLRALRMMAKVDEGSIPALVSVFQQRPYIYKNGEVRGGQASRLLGTSTPILRIGDSLTTGDPNRGTGFNTHVGMVAELVCRLVSDQDGEDCRRGAGWHYYYDQ